ncbi:post-GPI attachment to proteins factor 2-like isoform X2 [Phymastichus coffea]|uniref:post-GPI attachment to proteins factor 2-like isoform X2 n=1 Tax=Phymastichus coffea TaxID=108790 RepID=UPI00273B4AD3|nr:post-GPI attachment to proteins factor 2-like isoform X2 [Phymastichus coffea]
MKRKVEKNMKRLGSDYIPLVDGEGSRLRLVISFSRIAWFTVSLPFCGFAFCIIWSILYNFEQATETHCNVYNFLPSVSAAIGHYRPQKHIWEFTIAVQAIIRLLVLFMYYEYYKDTAYKWARGITNFALFSYFLENTALVTLSFWSSNENYVFHKISFITFLLMSLMHMVLSYIIAMNCCNVAKDTNNSISLKWKFNSMVLNVTATMLACYFFYRHNKYCEPFVYSMFALAEYVVVITNMAFHVTAAYDFAGRSLLISTNGLRII